MKRRATRLVLSEFRQEKGLYNEVLADLPRRTVLPFFHEARGISIPDIALELDRVLSTLYREMEHKSRNISGYYAASVAHSYATTRRRRARRGSKYPKECRDLVYGLLELQWSPERSRIACCKQASTRSASRRYTDGSSRIDGTEEHSSRNCESFPNGVGNAMASMIPGAFYGGNGLSMNALTLSTCAVCPVIARPIRSWEKTSTNTSLPWSSV